MTSINCEALRDDLVALLYEDGSSEERTRARDHLAQCVACRTEYTELKSVRKALGGWNLPVPEPVRLPKPTPARWASWGFAAAAGLMIGIGLAVAGRSSFSPAGDSQVINSNAPTAETASARFVSYDDFQNALSKQEARHQEELAELRRSIQQVADTLPAPSVSVRNASSSASATVVERLLRASEERQARTIEARLASLRNESDLQRQYDMAQIAASLAYIDSRTGADAARTSELMKNLVRVTAKPQDR